MKWKRTGTDTNGIKISVAWTAPVILIVPMVLVAFGTIAYFKLPSRKQNVDGILKADFHGFSSVDIQNYVEQHIREKDNVSLDARIIVMSITTSSTLANGDYVVPFTATVEVPLQHASQVVGTLIHHSDNSYSVKTSLDP